MSDPKPKDGAKPPPTQSSQIPAQRRPLAPGYLPGGQKYNDAVNDSYRNGNPRGGMPVPEWLRRWEQIWERSGGRSNNNGKPKL